MHAEDAANITNVHLRAFSSRKKNALPCLRSKIEFSVYIDSATTVARYREPDALTRSCPAVRVVSLLSAKEAAKTKLVYPPPPYSFPSTFSSFGKVMLVMDKTDKQVGALKVISKVGDVQYEWGWSPTCLPACSTEGGYP